MIDGTEMWKQTSSVENKVRNAQKTLERSVLKLLRQRRSAQIRGQTIVEIIKRQKWSWLGHVSEKQITDGAEG